MSELALNKSGSKTAQDRLISIWRDSTAEYRETQLERMREILKDPAMQNGEYPYHTVSYLKFKATYEWLKSWHEVLLDKE